MSTTPRSCPPGPSPAAERPPGLLTRCSLLAIRAYQLTLSPLLAGLGVRCRFTPTCSHYAAQALRTHGLLRGSLLSLRRLARCHPFGGCGHDPVPPPPPAQALPVPSPAASQLPPGPGMPIDAHPAQVPAS